MAVITGPILVDGPSTRDRYGLFSVAPPGDMVPHAVEGGIQWITPNCGTVLGYQVVCNPDLAAKSFVSAITTVVGNPFVVYSQSICGSVGFTEPERRAMAMQQLKAGEQGRVEAIFSEQLFGQAPGLSNNAAVVTVAGAAGTDSFADRIGQLEAAFYAAYGQQGTLHVPMRAGTHMLEKFLMVTGNVHPLPGALPVWQTAAGSLVSIGNYAGKTPAGAAPAAGHQWVYMTGPVKIWRLPDSQVPISPIEGALNRTTNQVTMLAERPYVMAFDCVVYAIDTILPTQTTD